MCTVKQTQEIARTENDILYQKFLEILPSIISSVANTMEHKTAPETHKRLVNLESLADQNRRDHELISNKIEDLIKYHEGYKSVLEDIRKGIEARNWLKKWIKDWWMILSIGVVLFVSWLKGQIEK